MTFPEAIEIDHGLFTVIRRSSHRSLLAIEYSTKLFEKYSRGLLMLTRSFRTSTNIVIMRRFLGRLW